MEQGACIGLYFINRPEWLIVDHACTAYSYISVPLYDTLGTYMTDKKCIYLDTLVLFLQCLILCTGPDAVKYVVNHADVQAIFCVPETLNTVSLIFAF